MWFGDAGEDATLDPEAPENKYSKKKDLWEPLIDEIKGDVARAVFYMAFRYSHASKNETKTPLVMNEINEIVHNAFGDAHDLAEWHQMDPPDEKEFHRNDIAEKFQGNRNPFIDRPEWAELIWPSLFSNLDKKIPEMNSLGIFYLNLLNYLPFITRTFLSFSS